MRRKGTDIIKQKQCPLSPVDWLHYITSEQNRERLDHYSEELSDLTKIVLELTLVNAFLVFFTVFITIKKDLISTDLLLIIFVSTGIVLIYIIYELTKKEIKDKKSKEYMLKTVNIEGDIVEAIIKGEIENSNEIREKYFEIWPKNK